MRNWMSSIRRQSRCRYLERKSSVRLSPDGPDEFVDELLRGGVKERGPWAVPGAGRCPGNA